MRTPISNLLSISNESNSYRNLISEESPRMYFNAVSRESHRLDETIHRIANEMNKLDLSEEEWNLLSYWLNRF